VLFPGKEEWLIKRYNITNPRLVPFYYFLRLIEIFLKAVKMAWQSLPLHCHSEPKAKNDKKERGERIIKQFPLP
jgi:hypothetical protein